MGFLEGLNQDVSYAVRTLRKNLAFAAAAVLTLALGVGGVTTMFTIINSVLLRPLAYSDPARLVRISGGSTIVRYEELESAARSYTGIGAFLGPPFRTGSLSGAEEPEVLRLVNVSANFLQVLGVQPILGRAFRQEDAIPGASPVMLISAELWQRRFAGDPKVAGIAVTLDSNPYTIIGVLPHGFSFPAAGVDAWLTPHMARSAGLTAAALNSPILSLFGRLAPQVSLEQANAELAVLHKQYVTSHPGMLDAKPDSPGAVTPFQDQLVANVRSMLWMLFGAASLVLMIGCANVAGLMLARSVSRAREFAVRASLGAGRFRLVRQIVAESVLLSLVGGALGVILASWSVNAVTGITSFSLPRVGEIRLNLTVLTFAALISIGTGIVYGLIPALSLSRSDLIGMLRSNDAAAALRSRGTRWLNTRGALVAGQIALSVVLLIGATLLMQSLYRLQRVNPGFNPKNLLTMQIALSPSRYDTDEKKAAFFDELVQRVHAIPGIRSATTSTTVPMTLWAGRPVQASGRPALKLNERPIALQQNITSEYFRVMEVPLRRGREFSEREGIGTPPVVIINESLARKFWPEYPGGEDPVGRHLLLGVDPRLFQIVGIVADTIESLDSEPRPGIYILYSQTLFPTVAFTLRTEGDPMRYVAAVRSAVQAIDRNQAVSGVRSIEDIVEDSLGQRRLIMTLLQIFAAVAATLALTGIYGVIAYSVTQRLREVGVRIALGAGSYDVARLLLRRGLILAAAGVSLGLAGAFSLTGVLRSFLFQVSPTDPLTFVLIALMFVLAAIAASYIPIRNALRIDPIRVLRHD